MSNELDVDRHAAATGAGTLQLRVVRIGGMAAALANELTVRSLGQLSEAASCDAVRTMYLAVHFHHG